MSQHSTVTPVEFERLLAWLDADRDRAGERYEFIRRRLIKIFASRGCNEAEELADETFNRVTLKVENLVGTYTGDPALYFYGVARNVLLEYHNRPSRTAIAPVPVEPIDEREYACLERCLENLPVDQRKAVLGYYRHNKQAKIDYRRTLATDLQITMSALRIRVHRIRNILGQCIGQCLGNEICL